MSWTWLVRRVVGAAVVVTAAVAAAWVGAAASAAEQAGGAAGVYDVKLDRPARAGERWGLTATVGLEQTSVMTVQGQAQKQPGVKFTLRLEGVGTTLAVDDRGRPTRTRFVIEKGTILDGNAESETLAKGTTVVATAADKDVKVEAEGGARLSPTATMLLASAFPTAGAATTPPGPRKVGESWPIDPKRLVADLRAAGNEAEENHVRGTATLAGVETVAGVECLRLAVKIDADRFVPAGRPKLPEGLKVDHARSTTTLSALLPTDPSRRPLAETEDTSIVTVVTGTHPKVGALTLESTLRRTRDAKYRVVE